MSLPRRWLGRLLDEAFHRPPPQRAPERVRTKLRARRVVAAAMHHRGLTLGAPLLRKEQKLSREAGELVPLVRWLAVLADHVDLVAHVLDAPELPDAERAARRTRAFATALALLYGNDEDAQVIATGAVPSKAEKALVAIERELVRRRYLQGNPILGLLLNHPFQALDAHALLDAVIDVYDVVPTKGAAARVQGSVRTERLATLAAVARLSEWREVIDPDLVRSAALWQVKALGLPRAETVRLLEQTKNPADLSRLVTLMPDAADSRARIFRYTVLAAWVDGRVSPEERDFVTSLGAALGLPRRQQQRIERRVMEFVRLHRDEFNPLTHAAGFVATSPPISVRVARLVFENIDALWKEIRETGDLALLLGRRAAGQKLSAEENKRMREQLVDVVKAVPSLAVFTLPGGFVLLPIMLKLLPFDLRPSSWRSDLRFRAFARSEDDMYDDETAEKDFLERL